jgi:hypothetical protein
VISSTVRHSAAAAHPFQVRILVPELTVQAGQVFEVGFGQAAEFH